jgi:serine/threonine protein kinase
MNYSNDGYFIIRDMQARDRTEQLKSVRLQLEGLLRERAIAGGRESTVVDDLPTLDVISDRGFETRLQQFQEKQKSKHGILHKVLTLGNKPDRTLTLKQFGEYYVPIWKEIDDRWQVQLLQLYKTIQTGVHRSNVSLYNLIQESAELATIGLRLAQLSRDLHTAARELGAMFDQSRLEQILKYAEEAERIAKVLNTLKKQAQDQRLKQAQPEAAVVISKARKNVGVRNGAVDSRSLEEMYDELEEIGAGGFGKIMRGIRKTDGKKVAIKVIVLKTISKTVAEQESNLQKYEKEIQLARKIQCQDDNSKINVPYCALVPIYDYWTSPDRKTLYIEMKLIEGYDGGRILINSSSFQQGTAKDYQFLKNSLISIANSLNHMHENCVLHRDVKPENMLYERATQRLYLSDYGLSCIYINECMHTAGGTLGYEDPLWLNKKLPFLNIKSDVYSLGVSFFELTFRKPFLARSSQVVVPILSLSEYQDLYKDAINRLETKATKAIGKDFKVMLEIIGRMMHPTEQDQRPTLQSIVLALQNNDIQKLEFILQEPKCATKMGGGGGKDLNKKKLHYWIVDQDE